MSTPTVRTFSGITLSILFIWWPSLFAGLAPDIRITTPTNVISIDSLKVGDIICGYGPTTHVFPDVKIKNIEPVLVESIYVITTKHGTITASTDQLFYEITSQNFIPAEQLKAGNLFLTKDIKALKCISVEHQNTQTAVYDLTLEEPHLFFSSDAQILTHNAVPILLLAIPAAVPPVIKFVASVGAIATALYIEKITTSSLPIFAQCRKRRERKAARQAFLASLNQAEKNPAPDNKSQTPPPPPIIDNTTPSGGQAPDPNDPKKKDEEERVDKSPEMNGKQSTYKDTTKPRSRYPNTAINVSRKEFEENLLKDKWSKSLSTDGKTVIYKKGGAKYVIREEARSTGGTTADYYKPESLTITRKIRFDMP